MPTFDDRGALLVNLTGSIAPVGAQYVVMALDGTLTNERVLTGTANQVIVTDGGAGGPATLSTPQDIAVASSPTFADVFVPTGGVVGIAANERIVFDAAGRVSVMGANFGVGLLDPAFLFHLDGTGIAIAFQRTSAAIAAGDVLVVMTCMGTETGGGATDEHGAQIIARADGAWAANDSPGRLEFLTTLAGTDTPAIRMTIKNDGKIGFGTVAPGSLTEWNFADDDLEFVDAHAATGLGSVSGVVEVQRAGVTGYIPIYDSYS